MLTPGSVIDGRYEILGPLGAGGMGQVYRARRVRLGDEVAVKTLGAGPATPDVVERFLRESRACAQLRHPHIVSILDFDVDADGLPFLVMELLSGPSVREELDLGGALDVARAAEIIEVVSGAIQLAHDRGITHRDLKPANIVAHRYASGERLYKVIDFGLVSHTAGSPDSTRLTAPFMFLGTMAYAAPEQLAGDTVGPAADQYALGVVAYELLTGRRPFEGADAMAVMQRVLAGDATPPSQVATGVPAAADAAIMRALARAPGDRWPTVAAFAAALMAALPAVAAAPAASSLDGAGLLARYELGEVLGPGRLGSVVRRGVHRALGVPVAIRHLKREGQPHWETVKARFLLEARTLQVRHPHLLHVRDFGEADGGVFVVTDLVEGPSLREVLQAGPLPWPRARRLILQMTDAADALHDADGLLTGVTPDTIRVTGGDDEHVVLTTGGVRTLQDVLGTMRESQLRGEESSAAELAYIAPEVLTGRPPDVRADVFTLGALGYQLLAGEPPFTARSLPELIGRMLTSVPPAITRAGVPAAAAAAVARTLAADPALRGTVAELQAAVREAGSGVAVEPA